MTMVLGTALSAAQQAHVLNAYLYRMTHESVRRWPTAAKQMRDGGFRLSLITDREWLAHTRFKITNTGKLDGRTRHCEHDHSCREVLQSA